MSRVDFGAILFRNYILRFLDYFLTIMLAAAALMLLACFDSRLFAAPALSSSDFSKMLVFGDIFSAHRISRHSLVSFSQSPLRIASKIFRRQHFRLRFIGIFSISGADADSRHSRLAGLATHDAMTMRLIKCRHFCFPRPHFAFLYISFLLFEEMPIMWRLAAARRSNVISLARLLLMIFRACIACARYG